MALGWIRGHGLDRGRLSQLAGRDELAAELGAMILGEPVIAVRLVERHDVSDLERALLRSRRGGLTRNAQGRPKVREAGLDPGADPLGVPERKDVVRGQVRGIEPGRKVLERQLDDVQIVRRALVEDERRTEADVFFFLPGEEGEQAFRCLALVEHLECCDHEPTR